MKNESVISNIEDLMASVKYVTMKDGLMTSQADLKLIVGEDKAGELNGYLQVSYNNETLSNIKISDRVLECLVQTKAKIVRRSFN
ncbi:hypothetical protein GLP21_12345 [Photobacterium carnosum]|uniref:Uncharacterized protein n=1 Tax=Photobacterium carnosum TaxID=2023717 RepID=A0A2N4UW54_9GAMM|nr:MULTISPECIES: hypothetical protein [Photobacterium]MCD9475856.1 hypothetical protein [Photobacterium phosphoreum]MCD9507718.1 hypothetical protein [Photobacterium phosphoreum]MCD9538161.1 hypothetical protein [Photobacterium carnosum]MCD9542552.1 hypothetical protein [Photobacterium carnosum]MCD9545938.1 hypothetical protein [Photobacterium carnosum]